MSPGQRGYITRVDQTKVLRSLITTSRTVKTTSSIASAGLHVTYVYVNYSVCNIAIIRRDNERQTILRGNGLTCGNESNSDNDFFNCSDDDKHRDSF